MKNQTKPHLVSYRDLTFMFSEADRNFIQIGAFKPARDRIAAGTPHRESPQINPEATAGA